MRRRRRYFWDDSPHAFRSRNDLAAVEEEEEEVVEEEEEEEKVEAKVEREKAARALTIPAGRRARGSARRRYVVGCKISRKESSPIFFCPPPPSCFPGLTRG